MIEIYFITESYGGIAIYTDNLSENLQQNIDYDVKTLSFHYNQEFSDLIKHSKPSKNMTVIQLNSYEQIRDVLGNKILKSTADIIHFQHEFNIFRSNYYFLELLDNLNYYSEKIIIAFQNGTAQIFTRKVTSEIITIIKIPLSKIGLAESN